MLLLLGLVLILELPNGNCSELSDKLYHTLSGGHMCFRRFNATHSLGCASGLSGSHGVLEAADTFEELQALVSQQLEFPVIAVIPDKLLSNDIFRYISTVPRSKLAGIIATANVSNLQSAQPLSFDSTCPNNRASIYGLESQGDACVANAPWNVPGSGILFESVEIPIFLLFNETEIESIHSCIALHNSWPKCGVKLDSFMQAAGNTEICLRRHCNSVIATIRLFTQGGYDTCDKIYGSNLLVSTREVTSSQERSENSVLLVVFRGDALSMFSGFTPSATYVAPGFTVLASSSNFLVQDLTWPVTSAKEVIFAIFDAEATDYIGSSTFSGALANSNIILGNKVLNTSHIFGVVEIGELGKLPSVSSSIFIHLGINTTSSDELVGLIRDAFNTAGVKTTISSSSIPLPPSSLHAILRKNKNLPSLLITDYESSSFNTNFYHSHRDTISQFSEKQLGDLTEALHSVSLGMAITYCEFLNQGSTQKLDCSKINGMNNISYVKELYGCFAGNCSQIVAENATFQEYFPTTDEQKFSFGFRPNQIPSNFDYYSLGINKVHWPPLAPKNSTRTSLAIIGAILHGTLGRVLNSSLSEDECKDEYAKRLVSPLGAMAYLIGNGTCVLSASWLQNAFSPLFDDNTCSKVPSLSEMLSSQESSWTESYWTGTGGQLVLFVIPNPATESVILAIGIVTLVIFFIFALFMYRLQRLATLSLSENNNSVSSSAL